MQSSTSRQQRRTGISTRQQSSGSIAASSSTLSTTTTKDRKTSATKASSLASSSRPATPNLPASTTKTSKQKEAQAATATVPAVRSPSPVMAEAESKPLPDVPRASTPPESLPVSPEPAPVLPTAPPGLPAVPPGLSAPPGLPPPSQTPLSTDSSPQIPMQISQGQYQMSTQARALVADIKARREATQVSSGPSPFPELDRMMQSLAGDNSFSFNLDPKLAADSEDVTLALPDFQAETSKPFTGNFFDTFPGVRQPPPGLSFPYIGNSRERVSTPSSSYSGSFNPFASELADDSPRQFSPLDEERKVSRFGFARGRQGSAASTSTSSPLHASTSLSHSESFSQSAYFPPSELPSPVSHTGPSQWNYASRHHDYLHQSASAMSSPLAQHAQAHNSYGQQQQQQQQQQQAARYQQQYDNTVSEAQLRDFITSSRDRTMRTGSAGQYNSKLELSTR